MRLFNRITYRIAFPFILAAAVGCASGCVCPEKVDMFAVSANWEWMGPEYAKYVTDDPNLSDEKKANRLEAVAELNKVIEGFKAGAGK